MPTNAQLTEQLDAATKRADAAEKRVETLSTDLATAAERADAEAKARQDAEKALDAARGEIADLGKSLRAYKGSATRARAEALVLKRERSPEARPIGAMKPPRSEEEAAARAAALEAAFADGPVELVFSDGKREIRELAPLVVDALAWQQTPHGRVLNHEPVLEPVGPRAEMKLAGFGLLDEAGTQVAYHALPEAITILSGQRMQIPKGCIRF